MLNEEYIPIENNPRYFLIKWLILKIIKGLQKEKVGAVFAGITTSPAGDKQEVDYGIYYEMPWWLRWLFRYEWCNQNEDPYCCDSYSGYLYYKIFPFVYLSFEYVC